jgi:Domain of unknown function (DUF4287)
MGHTPLADAFAPELLAQHERRTMSFQAYIDNIKAKTGKTPEDFRSLAENKGLLKPGVKAMEIVNWLKRDHGLGHGHAMAIYATFKAKKEWK